MPRAEEAGMAAAGVGCEGDEGGAEAGECHEGQAPLLPLDACLFLGDGSVVREVREV